MEETPKYLASCPQWKMFRARSLALTDDIRVAESAGDQGRAMRLLKRKQEVNRAMTALETELRSGRAVNG